MQQVVNPPMPSEDDYDVHVRLSLLDMASKLPTAHDALSVVAEAKVLEKYVNGD